MVWDPTKPPTNGDLISADIRNNWAAIQATLGGINLGRDSGFILWPAGDAAAPAHYSVTAPAGSAIARAGVGLGDTNRYVSDFCAKLTGGTVAAQQLQQQILPAASFKTQLRTLWFALGVALRCSSASSLRASIFDGIGSGVSDFHSGSGAWEWKTAVRQLNASASTILISFDVQPTIVGYVGDWCLLFGETAPTYPHPSRMARHTIHGVQVGNIAVGNFVGALRYPMPWPAIVRNTRMAMGTAPATNPAIWDVDKNGTANSMYTTKPQVAAGATTGEAAPDGTYANRCFARGDLLNYDQDAIGSGTVGADATLVVDLQYYPSPLGQFLAVSEVN